ncbi:hypothetical protein MKP08_02380 [Erythrobacter sp. LQ02-29]|uniref:hypothetical protein n=1 Tax=Erythrobacter sp. LQ02-29 TaxID=2920384 RepID=UPI001F4E5CCF|nr:hypothetical protein [Erythrobacter sp. LQ02-29]MCP9221595.1 hypothetical protein [Erythrobacter sp. LQ02-29]
MTDIYARRQSECESRIDDLRKDLSGRVDGLELESRHPKLAIYATGSLARREASIHSDLDAFFMLSGESDGTPMGRIQDVKIFNAVLSAAEAGGFPDFSNDGEYLKFIHIEDVITALGSRIDDYKNTFTARMLLMLESEWLYGKDCFQGFRKQAIEAYFTDFHDHSENFRPLFLMNDILRFWRTLCLNYENSRQWKNVESAEKSAKGHLGNLKLKFSRLHICFSFIAHLLSKGQHLSVEDAIKTSETIPFERLQEIAGNHPAISADVDILCAEYAWFLDATGRSKAETLCWISEQKNRDEAFAHAGRHIDAYGRLVRHVAEQHGYLKFLIV